METTTNFDELSIPPGCKVKYIQKMYYGKYVYKLYFEIDKTKLVKNQNQKTYSWNSNRFVNYTNRTAMMAEMVSKIKNAVVVDDYRLRAEGFGIGVFTNSEENVKILIDKLSTRLVEFYRPLNDKHADFIDKHRKVIVRNSLFEKYFKFKIYMKYDYKVRETRYMEVKEFADNLENGSWDANYTMKRFWHTHADSRRCGYTVALYLKDPSDLMMFQLRFNNDIEKIEEAVLLSELQG